MNDESAAMAALAANPVAGMAQAAAQPSAAQVARFEQLLYLEPAPAATDRPINFGAGFDQVAKVAEELRASMQPTRQHDPRLAALVSPDVLVSIEVQRTMVRHAFTHMNFTYVTKMIELTHSSVRTLFQQQG